MRTGEGRDAGDNVLGRDGERWICFPSRRLVSERMRTVITSDPPTVTPARRTATFNCRKQCQIPQERAQSCVTANF